MFTVPTHDGQNAPLSQITQPYRVRLVMIQAELEILNEHGKLAGVIRTSVEPVFEADFFADLNEFLKRQGITLADPTPVEVAPIS